MALRRCATLHVPILSPLLKSFSNRASSAVQEHAVSFIIVDKEGIRHHYKGLEGQQLHDVIAEIPEMRDTFMICAPGGRGCWDTHLLVTKEIMQKLPKISPSEAFDLHESAEDVNLNSRMASSIILTKELNGAVFALGDVRPWMTR